MKPQQPPDTGGSFLRLTMLFFISAMLTDSVTAQNCHATCKTCFVAANANSCMSCTAPLRLQSFQCLSACSATYTLDTNDNICKKMMTRIDNPCVPGAFNNNQQALNVLQCSTCTSGKYCESWALGNPQNDCLAGFYCTGGSTLRSPVAAYSTTVNNRYFTNAMGDICPAGTYCGIGTVTATSCAGGLYCPDQWMKATDTTLQCQAGFYCSGGAKTPTPGGPYTILMSNAVVGGNICPKGYYCGVQSSRATACSAPTFLPYQGASLLAECIQCTIGSYCPSSAQIDDSNQCTAGYFCAAGSSSSTATRCLQDYYCPTGTYAMKKCAAGQFTAGSGSATCSTCNPGAYCAGTGTQTPCPTGYYCNGDVQTPCASGTYMATAVSQSSNVACLACPQGSGCYGPNQKKNCDTGFYCLAGSQTKRPNNVATQKGGMCVPGYYCDSGSFQQTACGDGYYCPNYAAQAKAGACWPGFYCLSNSAFPDQNLCPAGQYCTGNGQPQLCPIGTYSMSTGAASSSDCDPCPAGTFCTTSGLTILPTSSCTAGYFCKPSSTSATMQACKVGYMCTAGTNAQIWCEAGSYQPLAGQTSCANCPEYKYCNGLDPTNFKSCVRGYYCPLNTKFSTQYPCPIGTYAATSAALRAASECTKATGGYYIQFTGQIAQSTKILKRYHANGIDGQTKPNPYICPQAMYCPDGSAKAIMCPNGQMTFWLGAAQLTDCIKCERGKWCKFKDMEADTDFINWMTNNPSWVLTNVPPAILDRFYGNAANGFLCYEGCTSATPASIAASNGEPCPIGYYCVAGDKIAIPCAPGTWNNQLQQGSCTQCTVGKYCPNFAMTDLTSFDCLAGYFCPAGSVYPTPCPAGTYNSPAAAQTVAACLNCPATMYCMLTGQLDTTDVCAKGFICGTGNDRPGPYVNIYTGAAGSSGRCPAGASCAAGGTTYVPCLAGQYQDTTQNGVCERCPPGYYCAGAAVTKKQCDAGSYCSVDSTASAPTTAPMGGICPVAYYCPAGTSQPFKCKDGTRNLLTKQSQCESCPSGYVCASGKTVLCPPYHFCDPKQLAATPSFTLGRLCLDGTWIDSETTGMNVSTNCTTCPGKQFCTAARIVGKCAPGYVCYSGADRHQPNIQYKAFACPKGYYCEEGTLNMTRCPPGTWTFTNAAKQISECTVCQMGFYCNYNNTEPQDCPPGNYCPMDSQDPIPCPFGTYQSKFKAGSIDDCLPCEGGYYCNSTAISNLFGKSPNYKCPLGFYCPRGYNIKPIPCLAGTYLDNGSAPAQKDFQDSYSSSDNPADMLSDCQVCPEHYYCKKGTGYRYFYPCPNGFICPAGQADPVPCPPGFFCKRNGSVTVKAICPVGYYCPMGTADPQKCGTEEVCKEGSPDHLASAMLPSDCVPGQYLSQTKCVPCEPGFVCERWTDQKFPSAVGVDGGQECPTGYYCPGGSTIATAKACPAGTYRTTTGAKKLSDCYPCPDGSATNTVATTTCTLCGRGSTHSADRTTCVCVGAFRTWQTTTNTCVCQKGYLDPVYTQEIQTATSNLDCQPQLNPVCTVGQFIDENNKCVSTSTCQNSPKCGTLGGYYSNTLNGCFCNVASSKPQDYCDANCEKSLLKAYYLPNGKIYLTASGKSKYYEPIVFGEGLDISGLSCPNPRCLINSVGLNSNGTQTSSSEAAPMFVKAWLQDVDPYYKSPYGTRQLADGRQLQAVAQQIPSSIKCLAPYDSVSFTVSQVNYPVYILQSFFNTDPNYDYGQFSSLATKLSSANMNINTFMATFANPGVYVFGDVGNPDIAQTIVLVTQDKTLCKSTSYPMTDTNMEELGIVSQMPKMQNFDEWLHFISPFFIAVAFVGIYVQDLIEKGIEKRELEARLLREGGNLNLKKYFVKAQDKFDKLDYLSDLYKLIEENLAGIKEKIDENERYTNEVNRDNMCKMLQDKYSLMNGLKKATGDVDLVDIKTKLLNMLQNLRFSDGRSLQELLEEMEVQKVMEVEEEKLKIIEKEAIISESSDESQKSFKDDAIIAISDENTKTQVIEELKNDELNTHDDIDQFDDLLRAKNEIKRKRAEFAASLDKNLTDRERAMMLHRFDSQMTEMERTLKREQEEQANVLKAKLAARGKKSQEQVEKIDATLKKELLEIQELQEKADQLSRQIDEIEENGINTKQQKDARDTEMKNRMKEADSERDRKLAQIRQDYLDRIKAATNPNQKEKLLGEMGIRLKEFENQLNEDRKKQDANLIKLLRARQKKNNKTKSKALQKEVDKLIEQIETFKKVLDLKKAQAYAEENATGLVDGVIEKRIDRITKALDKMFNGFQADLTKQEEEDMLIEKAQLEIAKEKELKSVEVQVEEELDTQARKKKQDMDDERAGLRKKIEGASSQEERDALLEQLAAVEKMMNREFEEEKRHQARLLDERRKRKADRMQIRKMRIEMEQVKEVTDKEIALSNKKFLQQMADMDDISGKALDQEIKTVMKNADKGGKEQGLIMVAEAHDEILARKLKILQSKQFFDLSKYLGTLHTQVGMEQMIKMREGKLRFDQMKEAAYLQLEGSSLEDTLVKIDAEQNLENDLIEEQLKKVQAERESDLRQQQEEQFCKEKKEILNQQFSCKRTLIVNLMKKYKDDAVVQEVGGKLVRRIDMSLEEEMADLNRKKENKLERARMRIIADNEDELKDLQYTLNQAMEKEEKIMNEQLDKRKQEILDLKKQNLDDRLKMAAGEMSDLQIKELKESYEKEFKNLETAITDEKTKQLTNMRAGLLQRRIDKEKKKKQKERDEEERKRREAVSKMNAGMAQAYSKMQIEKSVAETNARIASDQVNKDRLKARLAKWNRDVDDLRMERGGEEGEVWNIKTQIQELKDQGIKVDENITAESSIEFTVNELYARVLKVENLVLKVKDMGGVDMTDLLESMDSMSQTLNRRGSHASFRQ